MKNPTNNIDVCIPKLESVDTVYPVTVKNADGSETIAYQVIDDSEISQVMCDDVSLRSLLKAGVDPSKIGTVNTSNQSRYDTITNAIDGLSQIELPTIENAVENQNQENQS